ncbi:P-loop containing nucleoside triphosphate hydrolase protein [Diplogelasinospora grovesii]|uniref:ATP-dependent RNA helicase n=1 Tax=Diplogelasinospora grovesii TaxID=303347 RepID=A0AAN6S820_9PEZI|nr:P-loop containing nucleoside triphosphate hydrolase protein [Diplogelasinospora grovesii]
MMKSSILRHASVCRVAALGARRVQVAPRASATVRAFSKPTFSATASLRQLSPAIRFYSSEAAAPAPTEETQELVTKFADLRSLGVHQRLVSAITQGMKYENMTPVQSMTINSGLSGKDIVAQAKTGTGKTLAFLVPVIQRILEQQPELAYSNGRKTASCDDIRAIILSPTRELAEQIGMEAKKLVCETGVVVQTAVGGTQKNMMLQRTRREGCHILVATPGRLNDLLSDPSSGIDAPKLAALCLDEADRMLDVGFDDELQQILRFLPNRRDVPRQTLLFSATIPKDVVGLARKYIDPQNFEFVQTVRGDEVPTHEKVPQFIVPCKGFENIYPTLLELIQREVARTRSNPDVLPFKAVVFLPTTASVQMSGALFNKLSRSDREMPHVISIHSKLTQRERTHAADDFRRAKSAILFSSDVTARGMDFPNVSHVIQIHSPPDREQYIHRLGRTGRADKEGQGWLLVADVELSNARRSLPGLPIQRNTDLACASVDATAPDTGAAIPSQFEQIKSVAKDMRHDLLQNAYLAYLGGAMKGLSRQPLIDAINDQAIHGWGLPEPPAIPLKTARNLGNVRGIRVETREERSRDQDGFRGGSPGGGRRDSRGGRDGFERRDRRPRDSFEKIGESAWEDRRPRDNNRRRATF